MYFASDNWAGALPAVMDAIVRHNAEPAAAYGNDKLTAAITKTFAEIFEHDVAVYFTATGTAANALSMAAAAKPGGLAFCSADAHALNDEFGATEFFSGGMKLVAVPEKAGLMSTSGFAATLARYPVGGRTGPYCAFSLTQASEAGTVYPLDEVRTLNAMARERGMAVHMDGARFANALAALDVTPAELTWKAGVDILSFGGTKNGCLAAEAIVVFAPERFPHLQIMRQRAGQVVSKSRFVAAQFEGYFADGAWLRAAAHANAMSARLRDGIRKSGTARLAWESQANEVFPVLTQASRDRLRAAGAVFYEWDGKGTEVAADEAVVRLVTSFATSAEDVDKFLALM